MQLLIEQLRKEELDVLGKKPRPRWWGYIFPGTVELERYAIHSWFESATRKVKEEERRFRTLAADNPNEVMLEIKRFLADYEAGLDAARENDAVAPALPKSDTITGRSA